MIMRHYGKVTVCPTLLKSVHVIVVLLPYRFLEALEKAEECAFYYFLLGKLYWEMNGNLRTDKKKCLAQFLKVSKVMIVSVFFYYCGITAAVVKCLISTVLFYYMVFIFSSFT